MVKFTANNSESASAKTSALYTTQTVYPCMSFDIVDFSNISTYEQNFKQKALDTSKNMETT